MSITKPKRFVKITSAIFILCMLVILPTTLKGQATVKMSPTKKPDIGKWISERFRKGSVPPFSFVYGGEHSSDFIKSWDFKASSLYDGTHADKNYLYVYSDKKTGLMVECEVRGYSDYAAIEWVLRFKNTNAGNTPVIEQVKVVDLAFDYGTANDYILHYADGSHVSKADFHPRERVLRAGDSHYMSPRSGRSSDHSFPFFNIESGSGGGVLASIGWTGTWFADINRPTGKGVILSAGMKNMELYLYPEEEIRTPSICLLFWEGNERMSGHNEFRQFVLEHQTRIVNGQTARYPISTGFNFGDPPPCNEYSCLTEDYAIAMIRRYSQFGILPEVFWLDAGWYTGANDVANNRNWANTVGNWTPDKERFPNGLAPVADEVHRQGAKFMVWFEPERVMKGSQWAKEHPEWMLDAGGDAYLFDLGNPEACLWMSKYIGDFIEKEGIDYYRQDFNMEPDIFWEANDEPGRKGMKEIRHIEGLYSFWDYLLDRFPELLIDNCASGGRRIDFETTKRSAPLWRTDYHYGEPVGYQCHTYGLNYYLPLHGTGTLLTDKFTFRSSLGTSVIYNWKITNPSFNVHEMQDCLEEFKEVRPYFYEDYYPLSGTEDMTRDNIWLAYQLHRKGDNSGFVVAFRRENSEQSTFTVNLSGIVMDANYVITCKDSGEKISKSGEELIKGLTLRLEEPKTSLLLKYQIE